MREDLVTPFQDSRVAKITASTRLAHISKFFEQNLKNVFYESCWKLDFTYLVIISKRFESIFGVKNKIPLSGRQNQIILTIWSHLDNPKAFENPKAIGLQFLKTETALAKVL